MNTTSHKIIAIYGPTTSDKTGLALNLAKYIYGKYHINTEIVNVDSRKIYKGFVISQHLIEEKQQYNIPAHLYGTISPKKTLDLFDFQKLVKDKILEIQSKDSIPILVGGSTLHMRSVIENWSKGKKHENNQVPENVLVLGKTITRKSLKKAITKHVNNMFKSGLYKKFKNLYTMYKDGNVSYRLLNETHGYRQFLEIARVSRSDPLQIPPQAMKKIKHWMIKDLMKFGYQQALDYKRFQNIKLIQEFEQARRYTDIFLQRNP